jgi:hypothetical protein
MTIRQYSIPYDAAHVPLGIIEFEGRQWIVRETSPADGWTVIERNAPEEEAVRYGEFTAEVSQVAAERMFEEARRRRTYDYLAVAAAAVFVFLALMVGTISHLTFADVLGCIIAFLILMWMLPRRDPPRPRDRDDYYYPV